MSRWIGVVLAPADTPGEEMASRLVTYLHPVAGRPLVWHAASALASLRPRPEKVVVISGVDLPHALFQELPVPVELVPHGGALDGLSPLLGATAEAGHLLLLDAAALAEPGQLEVLLGAPAGSWLPAQGSEAAAARIPASELVPLLRRPAPLQSSHDAFRADHRIEPRSGTRPLVVRDRHALGGAVRMVRDRLVRSLMEGGVTFLLPDSVLVDVDVRIGRDSIIYPGAVLEGQTTIGEETVIGPGCRVIDSWVGSGVELRGWNYISHTSVRNRAILEPYVRRGFD